MRQRIGLARASTINGLVVHPRLMKLERRSLDMSEGYRPHANHGYRTIVNNTAIALGRFHHRRVFDRIGGQAWSLVGMISSNIEQPQMGVIDQPGATHWEPVTPVRVSPERAE